MAVLFLHPLRCACALTLSLDVLVHLQMANFK